jgi:hypothetical protein
MRNSEQRVAENPAMAAVTIASRFDALNSAIQKLLAT